MGGAGFLAGWRQLSLMVSASLLLGIPAWGKTWYVNASAASGGNGSSSSPYQTISQAVTASGAGDTVIVSAGTYHEAVNISSSKAGTSTAPYTLEAASGALVTVADTTVLPAATWSVWNDSSIPTFAPAGNVYATSTTVAARDLYSGYTRQPLARIPAVGSQGIPISTWNYATGTIQLTTALGVDPWPIMSMFVQVFDYAENGYAYYPVASIQNNGQTIVLAGTFASTTSIAANDVVFLCNHPALIRNPGEYAYDVVNKGVNFYYYPASTAALNTLQTRNSTNTLAISANYVYVTGLEIFGGTNYGTFVNGVGNVTLDHCIFHEGGTHQGGEGIFISTCTNTTVQNSVVSANDHGIVLATGNGINILKDHICFNDADGMDITGRDYTQGQTLDSEALYNVTISHCYDHNQISLEHPDDMQFYSGVSGVTIDSCYFGLAGQDMMSQDLHNVTVTNSIFFSSDARNIILGHGYVSNFSFTNCTIGFGRWGGTIGMDSSDVKDASEPTGVTAENNIVYRDTQVYDDADDLGPYDLLFDYNLYYADGGIIGQSTPPWQNFTTPAQVTSSATTTPAYGQEAHSTLGNPLFMNAPITQAVYDSAVAGTPTVNSLPYSYGGTPGPAGFAVGDTMEINGDGVARTVSSNNGTTITFSPPLAQPPYRSALLWDWGTNTNLVLDLRPGSGSPALSGSTTGGARGSSIDLTQYAQGIYDGVRDIPVDNANWTAAMTNPYQSFPFFGIPGTQTNYDTWRGTTFTAAQLLNPTIGDDDATPAGDQYPNLIKYALGLKPFTPYSTGSTGVPYVSVAGSYLTLTFTGTATDVIYEVQATNDPTTTWTTLQTYNSTLGTAPGTVTVQDSQTTTSSAKRFMRLVITHP